MKLVRLALADLWNEKVHLACTVAMIMGVVVPLAILLGVKTGVFTALMDNLRADREILRVTIPGDHRFGEAEAAEVRGWAETGFVALNTRAIARRLNLRREGGDRLRGVGLVPTGAGDPLLPDGMALSGFTVAASAALADQLGLRPGDRLVTAIGRGEPITDRLSITLTVAAVLPRAMLAGETLLMDPATMDGIEAFYDGYALPDWGLAQGRPLAERTVSYESLRIYARDLPDVAALEARLRARFDIAANSRAGQVQGVLALGRNLDLALSLVAAAALGGLFAALLSSFWATVQRKRLMLATLGLVGVPPSGLALVPVVQAGATALIGAVLSLLMLGVFAAVAQALFAGALPEGARVIRLDAVTLVGIVVGTVALAVASAFLAARSAARLDPAIVIREGLA
jgi:putative ABC transport system permease protein